MKHSKLDIKYAIKYSLMITLDLEDKWNFKFIRLTYRYDVLLISGRLKLLKRYFIFNNFRNWNVTTDLYTNASNIESLYIERLL